ncbi:hypothetical protein BGX30_006216, partial [Mortierella sp. GBA39]
MKFTTTLLALAAVASSAMAVVPIPVEGDAGDNGTTFANLLKWNNKLRGDCANLDVGHPLCVLGPKDAAVPKPTTPVKKPTPKPTKPVKKPTPKPTKPVKKPTPKPTKHV